MTGIDLKLRRVKRRIKARTVAEALGVSSSRLSVIENSALVTDEMAERYLAALRTFDTVPTPQTPSEAA